MVSKAENTTNVFNMCVLNDLYVFYTYSKCIYCIIMCIYVLYLYCVLLLFITVFNLLFYIVKVNMICVYYQLPIMYE